jgi:hypothetical protein
MELNSFITPRDDCSINLIVRDHSFTSIERNIHLQDVSFQSIKNMTGEISHDNSNGIVSKQNRGALNSKTRSLFRFFTRKQMRWPRPTTISNFVVERSRAKPNCQFQIYSAPVVTCGFRHGKSEKPLFCLLLNIDERMDRALYPTDLI